MNKWRVLSCCLIYFGNGMNDSAPGALIPYIEEDYHIGFATVALIFVSQAVGFILAAFFMDALQTKPGRAKSLMFAEALMLTGYTMIVCTPPFVVVVVAYLFLRYAMATNLSLNNLFCANLAQSTIVLGVGHGSYGVGGILGPIVATSMVSKGLIWSRYYFVPLGIRFICIAFGGWAFWAYEKETPTRLYEASERTAGHQVTLGSGEPTKFQLFKRALKTKVTLMGTLFIFSYQGAEVSISGWVISYLIKYKRGNPAGVGYVTAGFWVSRLGPNGL